MSQSQTCSCADRNCFHGGCACFTKEGVCSKDCKCRAKCENILGNEETITEKFAEYTQAPADQAAAAQPAADQAAAAQAAADQSAAAQAAAQPQPKPLPAQEPESKGEARNTSPSAVKMKFVIQGCSCRTKGCNHHRCPCFTRDVGCTSKCKCPATICVNPVGAKGDESNAQPGGQREPGSTQKPCRCDESKCENMNCICVRAGLPCSDRCECKDCDNTKTSKEKLQDRGIKREVPASGSGMSTMTAGAALAAKESAVGCNCQNECASGCGCVKRNIRCTSICKCKPRCGNDDRSRFTNKSMAGSGGQGGTRSCSRAVEPAGKWPKHG